MSRAFVAIFGLLLILSAGTVAMQESFKNAGSDEVVINESFTPGAAGEVVTLDNSEQSGAFYGPDNETVVYNATDTEMKEGTDYEWIQANGTVRMLSGGDLAGDANATISYTYQQTTEEQRQWARVMAALPQGLGLAAPMFILVLLLLLVKQ